MRDRLHKLADERQPLAFQRDPQSLGFGGAVFGNILPDSVDADHLSPVNLTEGAALDHDPTGFSITAQKAILPRAHQSCTDDAEGVFMGAVAVIRMHQRFQHRGIFFEFVPGVPARIGGCLCDPIVYQFIPLIQAAFKHKIRHRFGDHTVARFTLFEGAPAVMYSER